MDRASLLTLPSANEDTRLAKAQEQVREIERFAYRIVSEAVDPNEVHEAQTILRLTVGLRRKLDRWRMKDGQ